MTSSRARTAAAATVLFIIALLPTVNAQELNPPPLNSYRLTKPTNVANSTGSFPVTFNTATISLNCPVSPTVTLSSTADGTGKVFVDNFVNVTIGQSTTNVCSGVAGAAHDDATTDPVRPAFDDCFVDSWHSQAGNYLSPPQPSPVNPDTIAATFGVGPINLNSLFSAGGNLTARFDDIDWGGIVAASSLYVVTNCTVTGGTKSNNTPITSTNGQIQSFDFSNGNLQQVLTGNWSQPGVDTSLNAIPSVTNKGIPPGNWPSYVAGTSFATTQCLPHSAETDPAGNPLCKAYTLTCVNDISSSPSGTNCPSSSNRNIYFTDQFDLPTAYAGLLTIPNKTNNLGFGLLMGSDSWSPGNCVLTGPEQGFLCPQNLATAFHDVLSGGTTKGTNSTFVVVSGVPLPLTTVNGQANGGTMMVSTPNPTLTFTTVPPSGITTNSFTAAPIESVTYGIDTQPTPPATTLDTTFPIPGDQLATPTTTPSCTGTAGTFVATAQPTLTLGSHTLHFFATDCAATEELVYDTSDPMNAANWASFKTVTINVMGQFGGFLQPVDNPPTLNSVKAGSAVPVKFSLGGNYGLNIFASGSPASIMTTCSSTAQVDAIETTVNAGGSSLQYDPTSNTYTYVWKTSSGWGGTCRQLVLKFADGTSAYALFKFK